MDEIFALSRQLVAVQLSVPVVRLGERVCIDLLDALLHDGANELALLHASNREYVTADQLQRDIVAECASNGGRIDIADIGALTGVDEFSVRTAVRALIDGRTADAFALVGDALISRAFCESLYWRLTNIVAADGVVRLSAVAADFGVPTSLLISAVAERSAADAPFQVADDVVYNETFATQHKRRLIAALNAATQETFIRSVVDRCGLIDGLTQRQCAQDIRTVVAGEFRYLNDSARAVFEPFLVSHARRLFIAANLSANSYFDFSECARMNIPINAAKDALREADADGIVLTDGFLHSAVMETLIDAVSDAANTHSHVDALSILPNAITQTDAKQIVSKALVKLSNRAVHAINGTLLVSDFLLRAARISADSAASDLAMKQANAIDDESTSATPASKSKTKTAAVTSASSLPRSVVLQSVVSAIKSDNSDVKSDNSDDQLAAALTDHVFADVNRNYKECFQRHTNELKRIREAAAEAEAKARRAAAPGNNIADDAAPLVSAHGQRRALHSATVASLQRLYETFQVFADGIETFNAADKAHDRLRAVLIAHLLKTVGATVVDTAVVYESKSNGRTLSHQSHAADDTTLSSQERESVVQLLPPEVQSALAPLMQLVSAAVPTNDAAATFASALMTFATNADMRLRAADKKTLRSLVFNMRKQIQADIAAKPAPMQQTTAPAIESLSRLVLDSSAILIGALIVVHSKHSAALLHAPIKALSALLRYFAAEQFVTAGAMKTFVRLAYALAAARKRIAGDNAALVAAITDDMTQVSAAVFVDTADIDTADNQLLADMIAQLTHNTKDIAADPATAVVNKTPQSTAPQSVKRKK